MLPACRPPRARPRSRSPPAPSPVNRQRLPNLLDALRVRHGAAVAGCLIDVRVAILE